MGRVVQEQGGVMLLLLGQWRRRWQRAERRSEQGELQLVDGTPGEGLCLAGGLSDGPAPPHRWWVERLRGGVGSESAPQLGSSVLEPHLSKQQQRNRK